MASPSPTSPAASRPASISTMPVPWPARRWRFIFAAWPKMEAIMAEPANRDGVAILVRAPERSRKVVRVNITLSEDELRRIDEFAEDHGMTRSGFLAASARKAIGAA